MSTTIRNTPNAKAWFQVYPTVIRDEIRVISEHSLPSSVSFQLFDMLGRECRTWSRPGAQLQDGGLALPIAGLALGHYVLHIQSESHSQRQSLVVAE